MVKLLGFIGFMLVIIKAILYERTLAVCASMDFGKGLGRSEPWGDSRWSRWRKETMKTRNPYSKHFEKNYGKDLLYEKPENSNLN